jgi:DNA processing protein
VTRIRKPSASDSKHAASISKHAAALSLLVETRSRTEVRALCRAEGGAVAAIKRANGRQAGLAVQQRRELCRVEAVGLLGPDDEAFPGQLSAIPDAPLACYWRGSLRVFERPGIAIVGARRATRYGLDLARALARDLSGSGITIVSGLALGVDAAAHLGALDAGGPTIAVLGSGLNLIQPRSHLPLAARILKTDGMLFSEYPLNHPALPYQFPERNRLISGLTAGVVVIEASARSGSLITARLAGEQGRDVMAVPGAPGLPNSGGVNRLLKTGAALVESAEDVLDAVGLHHTHPAFESQLQGEQLTPELVAVLDHLESRATTVDVLAARIPLSVTETIARLTELELGGFVERVSDGYIRRPLRF